MAPGNSDLTGPQPFDDPTIETEGRNALNMIVLDLYKRTGQPLAQRPPTLGGLKVVEDPDLTEYILRNPQVFQKNFALVAALGESRFNLNGPRWAMFRDRTQQSYNKASKPSERAGIAAHYQRAIDAFNPNSPDGIETLLGQAAVKIFSQALQINPDSAAIIALFPQVRTHAMLLQHFSWGGVKEHGVLWQRAHWLDTQFSELFMNDAQSRDFVERVTGGLEEDAFHAAVMDLMQNTFAGTETTVATICWAMRMVGQNQALQDQLRHEAQQEDPGQPLMQSFLNEVMRCVPPIPFVVREVNQDNEMQGHQFKKGQQLILSIVGLHRHPITWSDSNQFRAMRPEFMHAKTSPKSFRPFLSGPRVCGGKRLAEMELMTAMPAILRKWRIVTDEPDVAFEYALALRPASMAGIRLSAI